MPPDRQTPRVIAHLLPWPAVGGTEHATLRIAQAVRERGFKSIAFCLREAVSVQALFRDEGFDTVLYDAIEPSLRHPLAYVGHIRKLSSELTTRRVDLLHCADVMAGIYAAAAGKLAGVPVLCHVRNQFDKLTRRERLFLSPVDSFAFVSRDTWQRFSYKVGPKRGRVLYDGVRVSTSRDKEAGVSVRDELGLSATTRLVGMIARVSPQKDYFTLARAAAQVVRSVPNVRFVVVGDNEDVAAHRAHYAQVSEELTRLGVSDAFIFTGFRSDVARMMSSFDVAVLSTNWEGLPLVVLESMALGIPTVATSVNGIAEVIPRPEVGLLFPRGDHASLARHLISVLTDRDAAELVGLAGQAFVKQAFSPEAFSSSLVDLYGGVLGSPPQI